MSENTSEDRRDLVSTGDVLKGIAGLLTWRLPDVIKGGRSVLTIDKKQVTWGKMLEQAAAKYPDNYAIKSEEAWLTYREYNGLADRYAEMMARLGLKKGDVCALFMETRPELLTAYSANAKAGVVNSMINTNLREDALVHAINLNPSGCIMVGEELIGPFLAVKDRLDEVPGRTLLYVPDREGAPAPEGMADIRELLKDVPEGPFRPGERIKPTDTISYVFTSGTTGGMPKAAVITHRRVVMSGFFNGLLVMGMGPKDTMYVPLPFFHTNALALSWPTVFPRGSALAVRRKFSTTHFLEDTRKYNATAFCYVGECCRYLMNTPEGTDDSDNPLRMILGNGLRPDIWMPFKKRFGIDKVFEIYGAAESNNFFVNLFNLDCTVGLCPTPYAIVEYNVDADMPVRGEDGFMRRARVGEAGLLLSKITDLTPFSGYTSEDATKSKLLTDVFEEGDAWFNTGDLLRDLGHKHAQFVDRLGDTFRWKGENVSTTEVEQVANRFPNVSGSTVYGVTMPGAEGRIGMIALVADVPPEDFDFAGFAEHFKKYLPHYAVPAFIRFKTEFETTATFKNKKYDLKSQGFDPAASEDPLFVLLPGEDAYRRLDNELYERVASGEFRF